MIIYKATNKSNGLSYIGQSVLSLDERMSNHMKSVRAESSTYFHNSLRKNTVDGFEWEIICEVNNQTCLDNYEAFYVKHFDTLWPNGYNLKDGGSSGKFTEEAKLKISKSLTGRKLSKEHKKNISEGNMGRAPTNAGIPHTNETKKKMSEAHSGKNNHFYGKTHTKEAREKISAAGKNRKDSEETKRKKSESIKLWWKQRKDNEKRK